MIVFNNFNNNKRNKMHEVDILIWATSLVQYKIFGYTTKLYCEKSDIEFLKKWHLYELYDIIDTDFLENNEQLKKVDESIFWSTRKIEEMYHELFELNEDCIYSDTDIIMNMPFDITKDYDVLLWSPEEAYKKYLDLDNLNLNMLGYVPWKMLSLPEGYEVPDYLKNVFDAYNCGIWHFKKKDFFKEYREEYYKFAIGNPGIIYHKGEMYKKDDIFPINSEQRILRAILDRDNYKVEFVMPQKKMGISKIGAHYFAYKNPWKFLADQDKYRDEKSQKVFTESILVLNATIADCLSNLRYYNSGLYYFYSQLSWLKGFEEQYYQKNNKLFIDQYY